ncbi:hypothetical protein BDQ17DRAFT_1326000 [Cyathus striatus]|nr:hypothetical protein BDQ17DRAFT_1326000 [Cyathus striatus]
MAAVRDFINALNESISGLYIVITKKPLTSSPLCTANGFIVQVATQATDCAILAIAITTVFNITRYRLQSPHAIWDRSKITLVTIAIWFLPVVTVFGKLLLRSPCADSVLHQVVGAGLWKILNIFDMF